MSTKKGMVIARDEDVELSKLQPHPKNPNVHPIDQIEALVKSMEQYTQYFPIVTDENYIILCGHGKKMALEKMGEVKAKVKVLTGLTEKQKLKLIIEDNKIQSLSYVNYGKIEEIVKEIGETDIIGFPTDFLEGIINEPLIDNMGVSFQEPTKKENKVTPEVEQVQKEEFTNITEGMEKASVLKCPHCGKEIVM